MTESILSSATISTIASLFAIAISSLTLGWTIYRDAVRKPRFSVTVGLKTIVQRGRPKDGPHIFVEALNMGPIPNRLGLPFVRKSWIKRRFTSRGTGAAFIYPDFEHPHTTKGAPRIEVGDRAQFVFPFDKDCFLKEDYCQVGVTDGFGRTHWCRRKEVRELREKFFERFS
jgi:hypothetical protein